MTPTVPGDDERFEIVILGGHLATGLLAAMLARCGVRVALVPAAPDAQLPAGESTVPYTAELFFLIGQRFGLPRVSALGHFADLPEQLTGRSGPKRNLGFAYHRAGSAHQAREALQFTVPGEHTEWHLFRPDVDAYACTLAAGHGATVLDSPAAATRVLHSGVEVATRDGRVIRGEYLVDGSGDENLRPQDAPAMAPARHHRATLLTARLRGLRPFEDVVPPRDHGRLAGPWSAGTLLHAFDGGWLQLVRYGPLGNREYGAVLSLDPRAPFTDPGLTAAAQASAVLERFPDLKRQFDGASASVPWRRRENWPAAVPECAGPRWMLFDRSAYRHDLLLSRDLTMSLEVLHATAADLLAVAHTGDWAGDGMKAAGAFQLRLFAVHDRFIAAGRVAARDFALWNAYLRVWLLWSILSALSVKRARLDVPAAGDWSPVSRFDEGAYWYQVPRGLPELIDRALTDIEAVERGAPPAAAVDAIFRALRREPFVPPLYAFGDPDARYYVFTRSRRLRMLLWAKTTAPQDFRRLLTIENVTGNAQRRRLNPIRRTDPEEAAHVR